MASFVTLLKFTAQGARNIKDTCKRAGEFAASARKLGIEIKEQYWCLGAYDGLILFEAPDDSTATAAMLALSSLNNVTTQTLPSFTAAEMGAVLGKLP
jgi:uncharacterized protein with GYD domain